MPSYKTKAIVLKSYNLGEADKILRLFSIDKGLVDGVAKGARKIKSRFGGRLELFNLVELELSEGRNMDIVNQAELLKNFSAIPGDFNKFLFAQFICEIILKTQLREIEINPLVFKLLYACLNKIDSAAEKDKAVMQKTAVFFMAKFLKITGYPPLIYECSACGKNIKNEIHKAYGSLEKPSDIYFSIRLGGILCIDCQAGIKSIPDMKTTIDLNSYRFFCSIFNDKMKICTEEQISTLKLSEIFRILEEYLKYHYDLNINTARYLKSIEE